MRHSSTLERLRRVFLTLALLGLTTAVALPVQATGETSRHDFSTTMFNPCAVGGVGENVAVTGTVYVTRANQDNDNRQINVFVSVSVASGVGLTTGDSYQVVSWRHPDPFGFSYINDQGFFISQFKILMIGPGSGNNHVRGELSVEIYDANGIQSVNLRTTTNECR